MIIHTKNGLDIDAIYLETIYDTEGRSSKLFYAQGRLIECDENNNEIISHDLLSVLCTSQANKELN